MDREPERAAHLRAARRAGIFVSRREPNNTGRELSCGPRSVGKGSGSGRIKPDHESTLEASSNVYFGGNRHWRGFRNRNPLDYACLGKSRQAGAESAASKEALTLFGRDIRE